MKLLQQLLAEKLLKISAIKLQPDNPFTWGSGWNAPIYTDNRMVLSFPRLRSFIKTEFSRVIMEHYPNVEVIAGVATAAIAPAALTADNLGLPLVYVRTKPKDHGLENLIEGHIIPGQKVVIVEDQVSTGMNSLKVAEALMLAGAEVLGMVTLFNYGFPESIERFKEAGIELLSLTNYDAMLEAALDGGYIGKAGAETLRRWRRDPQNWAPFRDVNIE